MNIEEQIEVAIQTQNRTKIYRLINDLLERDQRSPAVRLKVSDYFRRLSDYPRAIEVLGCDHEPRDIHRLPQDELQINLQHLLLRNLLGASKVALAFIKAMTPDQKLANAKTVGPILVSNYQYQDALPVVETMAKEILPGLDYRARLKAMSLSDVYVGLKRYDDAIAVADQIGAISPEPLIQGILHEIRCSIFVRMSKLKLAEREFNAGEKLFPKGSETVDMGYFYKWRGALAVLKGDFRSAKHYLDKSWKLLYRPGYKPEIWLEVLYWYGMLERYKAPKKFPIEWKQILLFPQPTNGLKKQILKEIDLPSDLIWGSAENFIDLSSDVAKNENGYDVGLAVTQQVLGYLVGTHPYGIPQYRLYDLLWPELWTSESHLKKRFEQAVMRMRRELKCKIRWSERHLYLEKSNIKLPQVRYRVGELFRGGIFFEQALKQPDSVFMRADVERFFGLTRGQARLLFNTWLDEKRITLVSTGKFKKL